MEHALLHWWKELQRRLTGWRTVPARLSPAKRGRY
jgi:hypothetical protein